jgi:hypothetical protein
LSILSNKASIEVTEAEEGLYALNCLWGLLITHDFDFFRIYFNTSYRDNKAQVFYTCNLEF